MGTLKNISGEPLEVPLLRRTVAPGDEGALEVDEALLTNPNLVWPAALWEVNGSSHEHDLNSPENLERQRQEAEAQAAAEEAQREQEAAAQPEPTPEPVTVSDTESPVPAAETEES